MSTIVRSALVGYSALQMYALVENIEAYAEFLPWCRDSKVLERAEARTLATLAVGLKGVRQSFTTENINHPPHAIEMRLIEGPFKAFHAAWRFQALGEQAAKIEFALGYEFSAGVLGKVLATLFEHIANTMVEAFIRRAASVYGPSAH